MKPGNLSIIIILLLLVSCSGKELAVPDSSKHEQKEQKLKQQEFASLEEIKKQANITKKRLVLQKQLLEVSVPILKAGIEICQNLPDKPDKCVYEVRLAENGADQKMDENIVFIPEQIIEYTRNQDELAIVVSHQLAHNMLGHIASRNNSEMIGQYLGKNIDKAISSQGLPTFSAFSKGGKMIAAKIYSTNHEKEADYIGLYITAKAGYDYHLALELWQKIALNDEAIAYFSASHPVDNERLTLINKTILEIDKKRTEEKNLLPEVI